MSLFGLGSRNQKTFRPKKNAPSGNKGAQLKRHIDATLGSGNLKEAVKLPPGEDLHEWLAVNTVDFFNQVNLLYGSLMEFCTSTTCPTMSAGPKFEYRWADGVLVKKPIEVSAPKYVEFLMDWIEGQLDDESIFPQRLGTPFPPNFQEIIKTIYKRLFRVYAHIYHSHFQKIVSLKEEAHLNTCFKHFTLFTWSEDDHLATLEENCIEVSYKVEFIKWAAFSISGRSDQMGTESFTRLVFGDICPPLWRMLKIFKFEVDHLVTLEENCIEVSYNVEVTKWEMQGAFSVTRKSVSWGFLLKGRGIIFKGCQTSR